MTSVYRTEQAGATGFGPPGTALHKDSTQADSAL